MPQVIHLSINGTLLLHKIGFIIHDVLTDYYKNDCIVMSFEAKGLLWNAYRLWKA